LRYTPSASGHPSESAQVVITKQLLPDSEARCATLFEKCGLDCGRKGAADTILVARDPVKKPGPWAVALMLSLHSLGLNLGGRLEFAADSAWTALVVPRRCRLSDLLGFAGLRGIRRASTVTTSGLGDMLTRARSAQRHHQLAVGRSAPSAAGRTQPIRRTCAAPRCGRPAPYSLALPAANVGQCAMEGIGGVRFGLR